jgi:hypothetical protein
MKVTSQERISRAFIILRDELKPAVIDALSKADGAVWERRMQTCRRYS